jgi:23S rRNA (adenine2503-C2)-methyltransferase
VQYQWTLIAGVNDGDDEVERLVALLTGAHAIVNFIPLNEIEGYPYRRPAWAHGVAIVRRLRRAGIVATLRRSGGQDIEGACGQLRARSLVS